MHMCLQGHAGPDSEFSHEPTGPGDRVERDFRGCCPGLGNAPHSFTRGPEGARSCACGPRLVCTRQTSPTPAGLDELRESQRGWPLKESTTTGRSTASPRGSRTSSRRPPETRSLRQKKASRHHWWRPRCDVHELFPTGFPSAGMEWAASRPRAGTPTGGSPTGGSGGAGSPTGGSGGGLPCDPTDLDGRICIASGCSLQGYVSVVDDLFPSDAFN